MGRSAIVLGATGLTGSLLLDNLLSNSSYSHVIAFVRSKLEVSHPKLSVKQINLLQLLQYKEQFIGNVVFCCIGTTKTKTPDKNLYRKIDYGIPLNAAKICEINGISNFIVLSSIGANSHSSVFYSRIKGEMEQAVLNTKINHIYILRPSLIMGKRGEFRLFEMIAKAAMTVIDVLLVGRLKNYRTIKAKTIAEAMINLDLKGFSKTIIECEQIKKIAQNA